MRYAKMQFLQFCGVGWLCVTEVVGFLGEEATPQFCNFCNFAEWVGELGKWGLRCGDAINKSIEKGRPGWAAPLRCRGGLCR